MKLLSERSIAVIVAGTVVIAALIIGFFVWKILDEKRRKEQEQALNLARMEFAKFQSPKNEGAYTEIMLDGKNQSSTEIDDDFSTANENMKGSHKTINNSAYTVNNFASGDLGHYAKLHEVHNHVENVYGELSVSKLNQNSISSVDSLSSSNREHFDHLDVTTSLNELTNEIKGDKLQTRQTNVNNAPIGSGETIQPIEIVNVNWKSSQTTAIVHHQNKSEDLDADSSNRCE